MLPALLGHLTDPASSVIGSVMDNWTLLITINFMMTNKSRSMIITSTTSYLSTSGDTTHHETSQDQHHDLHKKNISCSSPQHVFDQLNLKKTWKECARVPFIGLICWTEYMAAIRPDVNHYVINGSTVNAWNLQMMVIPTEAHPLILIFLFNFSNLLRMFWVNKIFGWRASPTLFVPQILFTEFWVKGSEKNIIQELNFLFRNNMPKDCVADSVSFINESVPQLK